MEKEHSPAFKETPQTTPSIFNSSRTQFSVGENRYTLRVLKMIGSTMLFLSNQQPECLDEMAMAMPMPGENKEVLSTNILGEHINMNSYRLAEKLSRRFERPFIVSHNSSVDRITEPVLEKVLIEYINTHKEQFV